MFVCIWAPPYTVKMIHQQLKCLTLTGLWSNSTAGSFITTQNSTKITPTSQHFTPVFSHSSDCWRDLTGGTCLPCSVPNTFYFVFSSLIKWRKRREATRSGRIKRSRLSNECQVKETYDTLRPITAQCEFSELGSTNHRCLCPHASRS